MGLFDEIKDKATSMLGGSDAEDVAEQAHEAAEKAADAAEDQGGLLDKVKGMFGADKVESATDAGIGAAGDKVDEMTGGKFSDQIDSAQQQADDAV